MNVHARGALVTRSVDVPTELPEGDVDLEVPGITVLAEGGSLRAALPGSARAVVSVRSAVFVPDAPATVGASVERVRALDARIARLDAEVGALTERARQLSELSLDPRFGTTGPATPVAARTQDALACAGLVDELAGSLDARLLALEARRLELTRERDAAALEDTQSATAARVGAGHPTRRVTVRVTGRGAVPAMDVAYVVPAARWWPVYTLRITEGNRKATWWVEALVAQLTGEDWAGVKLSFSSGDLLFDARLPELASLRFGRAQAAPKRGYRAAPQGLDRMFSAYDRAFGAVVTPEPVPFQGEATDQLRDLLAELPKDRLEAEEQAVADEPELTRTMSASTRLRKPMGGGGEGGAAPKKAMMEPQAMPPPAPRRAPAPGAAARASSVVGVSEQLRGVGGKGGLMASLGAEFGRMERALDEDGAGAEPPSELEPADAWLDFDTLALQGPGDAERRGRLARSPSPHEAAARAQASGRLEGLDPAPGVRDPRASRGVFDHRYDAEGLAEVASDAQAHRVMLGLADTVPTIRYRAVPREALEVYREAELRNPFPSPLLAGPVDVYVDGSLLAVTAIEGIDRGGTLHVGMGLEERLRVARNVRTEEQTAGILGGDTEVRHTVTLELSSALATPSLVEVVDRVPVTDEKGVTVTALGARPEAEAYRQVERGAPVRGGLLWKAIVPAGGRLSLEHSYRITLPSKNEVVGGNRRD